MKILFYSPDASPIFDTAIKTAIGGAELRAYNFAKYLASKTINVFFLVNQLTKTQIIKDKITVNAISYYQTKQLPLINRVITRLSYLFNYKHQLKYEDFLKKKEIFKIKPDYIFVFGITGNTFGVLSSAKIIECKVFLFIASDEDLNFNHSNVSTTTKLNTHYSLASELVTSANVVFVQNQFQQTTLKTLFNIPSKILLNPINLEKNELPLGKEFLLWVGKSSWYKQPLLFIKMAIELPKENFVMICNKTDEALYQEILQLKPNNCIIIEHVPVSDIESYFAKAKLLVNTSEFEGFPNTFLQAAKYGKPIVSYQVNPNEFITKHKCGVVAFGEVDKMMKETHQLLDDDEHYSKYSVNAKAYSENHAIDRVGAELLKCIV